jgi:hypothetical protein
MKSQKIMQQQIRRLKTDERAIISQLDDLNCVNSDFMSASDGELEQLSNLIKQTLKFRNKVSLAESKNLKYTLDKPEPTINKKLYDCLCNKYQSDKGLLLKTSNDKQSFKKEVIKASTSKIIWASKEINDTLEAVYDNINIYPKMIRFKKIEPEVSDSEDEPEDIFNGIANN